MEACEINRAGKSIFHGQRLVGGELEANSSLRPSDAYHSCYVLSGLSAVQHKWELVTLGDQPVVGGAVPTWTVSPYPEDLQIFDERDRVGSVHPVYTIPELRVAQIMAYFESKTGF